MTRSNLEIDMTINALDRYGYQYNTVILKDGNHILVTRREQVLICRPSEKKAIIAIRFINKIDTILIGIFSME